MKFSSGKLLYKAEEASERAAEEEERSSGENAKSHSTFVPKNGPAGNPYRAHFVCALILCQIPR